jgi:hypothetical protein
MSTTFDHTQLRTLTDTAVGYLRKLNDRDHQAMAELRAQRAVFESEIASIDDVMKDLERTVSRREAKMRGDVIASMPTSAPLDVPPTEDPSMVSDGHTTSFSAFRDDLETAGGHS